MASLPPAKDRTPFPPPQSSPPRQARSSSKSPRPNKESTSTATKTITTTTTPTATSSGISTTTTATTADNNTDAATPLTSVKKKRARRPVVKTTSRYMSESDHGQESIPQPDPEVEAETRDVSGSVTTEAVVQEEPIEATTSLLEERVEDLPHIDTSDSFAIIIPETSMLKAKPMPSFSSSPASSSRVKKTTTDSPFSPEAKKYTPRSRKLLESESESETEMEPKVDTKMKQRHVARVDSDPTAIMEMQRPAGRNLVLGDDDDEKEVRDEPVETPDWTFEELAKETAATIDELSPDSSSARSPKPTSQRQQLGRMHADKEADAVDEIATKKINRRGSTDKTPLARIPTAQAQEEPIFVNEVHITNKLLNKSRTPPTSRPTTTQQQGDSIDLERVSTANRLLNKGKTPLKSRPTTTTQVQKEPIFVDEVQTTNHLLSRSKAPLRSRLKATQAQKDQQHSAITRESSSGLVAESSTEEVVVATPQKAAVMKTPILVEEMKKYQQHFGFREKKPHRLVDYVHVYDWMSPTAPVRKANNEVQRRIDKLSNELEKANQAQELRCPKCAGDDLDSTPPQAPGCSDCKSLKLNAKAERARLNIHNRSIEEDIISLRNGQHPVPPTDFQSRCHWCGIRISDDIPKTIEEQFVGDQVHIKGVGILPLAYKFDHEQKRLCLNCSYHCGVLLKAKRKFQLLYELSARIQPQGCITCGIRESDGFQPDTGHVGLLCSICCIFKKQNEQDFGIPKPQIRIKELQESIADHSVDGVIRWDRIANDSRANPNFVYSVHGLLHRWIQHQKIPEQPGMSTFILLQHNHLTRKNLRSQLYTCHASTPTQAALYFSRFVALYKNQPMTYLYIRKLEAWNIPASQGDDWEDQSSGLETFEELKQRIRESVLKESPRQLTKDEIRKLYDKVFPVDRGQVLKTIPPGKHDNWRERLVKLLSGLLDIENQHLLRQLHFDDEAWNQYLLEWFVPRRFFAEVAKKLKASSLSVTPNSGEGSAMGPEVDIEVAGFDDRVLDTLVEEKQGLIRSSTGLGFVPLDPPEPRFKQLPEWAQKRARKVHQQAIQDERLNHIHQRHLFYESVGESKPKDALGFDLDITLKDAAAALFAFCTTHGFERSLEDCIDLVHKARERGGDAETGSSTNSQLNAKGKSGRLRKIFVKKIVEIEQRKRANGARASLPSAHDPTPMPSAQLPTHLVPVESQVHVYQAVLTAETRTVDVRLVRTERYKLQGDCLAGGGPIQVPKIINREVLRGFYREADRAERYAPVVNDKSEEIPDTTIVLRADKSHSGSGLSGVETWKVINLDTMIELGVAEPPQNIVSSGGRVTVRPDLTEKMARKPEVLKQRREKMCEVTGLSRRDVQIMDRSLYRIVSREALEGSGSTGDVNEILRQKRRQSEDVEIVEDVEEEDWESAKGSSRADGGSSVASRTSTSPRPYKRARSSSSDAGFQTAEEMNEEEEDEEEEEKQGSEMDLDESDL
ncbi:hypothetical protein BG015_006665 [Linnemannia schmuckeri]|uniref:Uncharacterized protein n=1 Tax=Linnemannia schmuckeri TaxID=64567 RepID=A0A9P5S1S7_9FUNG|nr:hypothetical protein BG015_006665 [Linnemannia schmuckeri]